MKQIVVLSGKGGTGKTVLTGALAALIENKVIVDCDVDAADLHLLLSPQVKQREPFWSGQKAWTDTDKCVQCGQCLRMCRFGAITQDFQVDAVSCEGCGLCARLCPSSAIQMKESLCGEWFISDTRFGRMVHAQLGIGEENSGKLVAKIRQVAKEEAEKANSDWIIIDGPPGIGCPVMASLSGVDVVLLVVEPTCSGMHDAQRVLELAGHFRIPVQLVVNKWDLAPETSKEIEEFFQTKGVILAGRIPFDRSVVDSVVSGQTILEGGELCVQQEIEKIWDSVSCSIHSPER